MPFNIGPFELLLVLVLALLVLGPGKLPEVGNALGRTIREFRKATTEVEDAVRLEPNTATTATATTTGSAPTATPVAPAPPAPVTGDVTEPTTGEHSAT
jgi:sec-independent protein translocase protein TatA